MPPKAKAKAKPASIAVKPNSLKGTSVIITGDIEGQTRASANAILEKAGAKIEKSLNKKVQLVVLGGEPGPQKLEKIEDLGLETKEWDDLMDEIKAGGDEEVPGEEDDEGTSDEEEPGEEAPKKSAKKANTKAKAKPAPTAAAAAAKPSSSSSSISGKTVIITGTVPGHDRKDAEKIVADAGASVAKSLNKSVELVILGTNPGPDKLKKIEDLGIDTTKWTELAEELGIEVTEGKPAPDVETTSAPASIEGKTVIVSGTVEGHTRSSAQKLLEDAGATYAKSLNKSVELVILGTKPGPDKLAKINELGVETVTWSDLSQKLGLDAEASEPPKKKAKKT